MDFVGVVLPAKIVPWPTPAAGLRSRGLRRGRAPLGQGQGVQKTRIGLAQFRVIERLKQHEKDAQRMLKNLMRFRAFSEIRSRLFY